MNHNKTISIDVDSASDSVLDSRVILSVRDYILYLGISTSVKPVFQQISRPTGGLSVVLVSSVFVPLALDLISLSERLQIGIPSKPYLFG